MAADRLLRKPPLKNRSIDKVRNELRRVMDYPHVLRLSVNDELTRGKVIGITDGEDSNILIGDFICVVIDNKIVHTSEQQLAPYIYQYGARYVDIQWIVDRDITIDIEFFTKIIRSERARHVSILAGIKNIYIRMLGGELQGIHNGIPESIEGIIVRYNAEYIFQLPEDLHPYLLGLNVEEISEIIIDMIKSRYETPGEITPSISGGTLGGIGIADKEDITYVYDNESMIFVDVRNEALELSMDVISVLISRYGISSIHITWVIPHGVNIMIDEIIRHPGIENINICDVPDGTRMLSVKYLPEFILHGG